jgi:hypothetical protein
MENRSSETHWLSLTIFFEVTNRTYSERLEIFMNTNSTYIFISMHPKLWSLRKSYNPIFKAPERSLERLGYIQKLLICSNSLFFLHSWPDSSEHGWYCASRTLIWTIRTEKNCRQCFERVGCVLKTSYESLLSRLQWHNASCMCQRNLFTSAGFAASGLHTEW